MKKVLYILPRVCGILAILFISVFALDVFEVGKPISEILIGLFMHLIPSYILIAVLVLAWKKELWGGILFLIASVVPLFLTRNPFWANLILSGPFFLTGLLFLADYFSGRKT